MVSTGSPVQPFNIDQCSKVASAPRKWIVTFRPLGGDEAPPLKGTIGSDVPRNEITLIGRVAVNKDFGFGYRYDVLVEDATITPE